MNDRTRDPRRPLAPAVAVLTPPAALLELDPGRFAFSLWRNVSISLWANQPTLAGAERYQALSKRLDNELPEGRSHVTFILNNIAAPTPEANAIFAHVTGYRMTTLKCMAIVLEGTGFWASGIRGLITNLTMSSAEPVLMDIGETIERVVEWLPVHHAQRTTVQLDPAELKRVLEATRVCGARERP